MSVTIVLGSRTTCYKSVGGGRICPLCGLKPGTRLRLDPCAIVEFTGLFGMSMTVIPAATLCTKTGNSIFVPVEAFV